MSHLLKEFRGKIDLIYIDPPFDSKADYKKNIKIRSQQNASDHSVFEEKQYTDIWTNDEYLQFMYERIAIARELLSNRGSFFLHCDPKKSHHLRCVMDEIFGPSNFVNEIAWCYKSGGAGSNAFAKKHDSILYYAKDISDYIFNPEKEKSYVARSGNKNVTYYEDEKGTYTLVNIKDWWDNIGMLTTAQGGGRTGYPTEKPPKLLERIIRMCSKEDSIIFDCFMGSGTTQFSATELGRKFIGADINSGAIHTTLKRLALASSDLASAPICGIEVFNVNNYDLFRNPVEAKELLVQALEVQPLDQHGIYDGEKDGRMVKIMPVNRIATKADLGELVAAFDQKLFQKRQEEKPNQPVEKILLVCMGHEPDLKAELELQAKPFRIDVEVVDILRDKSQLEFKRDSEAKLVIKGGELIIENFYPMNLLQKLSLQQEQVGEWRELVDSVMVDWNYDGAVLQPAVVDVPDRDQLVSGRYAVPADAGTIRVKITDVLSECWEGNIDG